MQLISTLWQGQDFLSASTHSCEAFDLYPEDKKVAISFEMLGHSCEKAIQYSIYENWFDERISMPNNAKKELELLAEFHMPQVLSSLTDAGFNIQTPENNNFLENENLQVSIKKGLFADNASGIILECANFKVLPKKNIYQGTLDNFLPAIWKFKCLDSKTFEQLAKKGIVKKLKTVYAQLQALMATSKISHALFSCMDATSHEVKHIWLEFDEEFYEKSMRRLDKIISNTKHGLWHMPLAKDVISSCGRCSYRVNCLKKCAQA